MTDAVIDASALVALLVGDERLVDDVAEAVAGAYLHAPAVLPFEVASTLRRLEAARLIDPTAARLAYQDALSLPVDLWPLDPVAVRVWQLRHHVSPHDAAYVAIAEELGAPLVTADARLTRSHGVRCTFRLVAG